jgi:serine/threonine-protein kinase
MAPEQITDYRDAKPPADQYAAAATLYQLLTGHYVHPVGRGRDNERLMKILLNEPTYIGDHRADIPEALAAAIHRGLNKDPNQRFASAGEFRQALLPFACA